MEGAAVSLFSAGDDDDDGDHDHEKFPSRWWAGGFPSGTTHGGRRPGSGSGSRAPYGSVWTPSDSGGRELLPAPDRWDLYPSWQGYIRRLPDKEPSRLPPPPPAAAAATPLAGASRAQLRPHQPAARPESWGRSWDHLGPQDLRPGARLLGQLLGPGWATTHGPGASGLRPAGGRQTSVGAAQHQQQQQQSAWESGGALADTFDKATLRKQLQQAFSGAHSRPSSPAVGGPDKAQAGGGTSGVAPAPSARPGAAGEGHENVHSLTREWGHVGPAAAGGGGKLLVSSSSFHPLAYVVGVLRPTGARTGLLAGGLPLSALTPQPGAAAPRPTSEQPPRGGAGGGAGGRPQGAAGDAGGAYAYIVTNKKPNTDRNPIGKAVGESHAATRQRIPRGARTARLHPRRAASPRKRPSYREGGGGGRRRHRPRKRPQVACRSARITGVEADAGFVFRDETPDSTRLSWINKGLLLLIFVVAGAARHLFTPTHSRALSLGCHPDPCVCPCPGSPLPEREAERLIAALALHVGLPPSVFTHISVAGAAVAFQLGGDLSGASLGAVANSAVRQREELQAETGLHILQAGVGERAPPGQLSDEGGAVAAVPGLLGPTVAGAVCLGGVLLGSLLAYCLLRARRATKSGHRYASLAAAAAHSSPDPTSDYQELCRQRMAIRTAEKGGGCGEPPPAGGVSGGVGVAPHAPHGAHPSRPSRMSSLSSQLSDGGPLSPSPRSSVSSWSEEPAPSNLDITTGHMILSYMEDHVRNGDRLEAEWDALCCYQAEPNACTVAQRPNNTVKNRYGNILPYDHARVALKAEANAANSDYINASPIMDHDPRTPVYIAAQGPLANTVVDFWQMVWESGCTVVVMLTPLMENRVEHCYRYWPEEGSRTYHVYEVNLVSEHVWCEDFLVRSLYLKNALTAETRTLTQFHYLSWPDQAAPSSAASLLDFRRKVNKCYRGRSCPVIVHCSDGSGRTGVYILIDLVLSRLAKGTKEIDIAATLEFIRDQRLGMVETKEQFGFALTAVAEEVNAILRSLPTK
ncbi:uncharacterized protein LOC144733224 [Lampetra planeri]